MASTEPAVSRIHFSTRDLPKRDRVPFWRELYGRHVIRTQIETVSKAHFDAQGTPATWP